MHDQSEHLLEQSEKYVMHLPFVGIDTAVLFAQLSLLQVWHLLEQSAKYDAQPNGQFVAVLFRQLLGYAIWHFEPQSDQAC